MEGTAHVFGLGILQIKHKTAYAKVLPRGRVGVGVGVGVVSYFTSLDGAPPSSPPPLPLIRSQSRQDKRTATSN